MNLILDTHIWIWWMNGEQQLSDKERKHLDELAKSGNPPWLSDMSLWEAQMLHQKGRLNLQIPFSLWLQTAAVPEVVRLARISPEVVLEVEALPKGFHGDPADRIIVATAKALNLTLWTHDKNIFKSKVVRTVK